MKVNKYIIATLSDQKNSYISSLIIAISKGSVILGILTMIVTTFFIEGFQNEINHRIKLIFGDLLISKFDENASEYTNNPQFSFSKSKLDSIQSLPNVQNIQAFRTMFCMLKKDGMPYGTLLKGGEYKSNPKERTLLVKGNMPKEFNDIVLSKSIATHLNAQVGEKILIYTKSTTNQFINVRKMKICGIYSSSIADHDDNISWCNKNFVDSLQATSPHIYNGIQIFLKDSKKTEETANLIWEKYLTNPFKLNALKERFTYIIDWLALQNINEYIILIIMFFISLVNMISCILILILDRLKMIAILKTLGARKKMIRKIFLGMSSQIIMKGMFWGNALALAICFFQWKFHFIKLPEKYYFINYAPIYFNWTKYIFINIGFYLLLNLALILPTLIIEKLYPVKILKFK